jgi:alginate O-acetyltransferase complex protein AlgI
VLFNSLEFIAFFLIVTPLYYLLPHKFRWFHLLVASCWFYMAFVPIYIVILFGTIIIDYVAGILIEQARGNTRKHYLVVSLVANIGVLFVFKYYNFFIGNINDASGLSIPLLTILLPIGLSFHTFQAMSYTIEVYRGNQKAEKHFGIYALYVMFYPQLVAGPIERPQNILHQFHERKYFSYENVVNGLKMIAWGMFKKVVIADRLAVYVNEVFDHHAQYEGIPVIMACVFFALQIYLDFSAYSDIALGCAKTLGFDLMVNFRSPYFARSIAEFWSRWHISLSTWFRDYLYIPLGGNRISKKRTVLNQFIVFMISGFWHGANWTFVFWGFLHGTYVSV